MTRDNSVGILPPTPTCMYCGATYYTEQKTLGDLTHGVCSSPLCALELILDNSTDLEQFERNLIYMDERRKLGNK